MIGAVFLLLGTTIFSHTTPNGEYLVEVCDCDRHQVFELRSRREPDGPWHHISQQVPALEDVRNDVVLTNDRVAWAQGETASGSKWQIRSAKVDGSGAATVLSHPHPQSGQGFDIPLKPWWGGGYVRFRSDPYIDETFGTYVVSIEGGAIKQLIFEDGFESGGRTKWS